MKLHSTKFATLIISYCIINMDDTVKLQGCFLSGFCGLFGGFSQWIFWMQGSIIFLSDSPGVFYQVMFSFFFLNIFFFSLQFVSLWCSPLCPTTLVFLLLLALASVSTLHLFCWTGCRASYIITFTSSCWNWLQPAWSYTCWVNLLPSM